MCWLQELQLITTQIRFSDWAQGFPLTEDIEMCQLPTLDNLHGQIDFTIRHRAQLTDMQEVSQLYLCLSQSVTLTFVCPSQLPRLKSAPVFPKFFFMAKLRKKKFN